MKMVYRTKGGASPQGKQKIYFSYCEKDTAEFEQTISEFLSDDNGADYAI